MHIGRQYDDDYNAIIPDDCFTCGMGLYVSLPYGYGDELLVLEVVDLGGQKLGKGREDYCFLVAPDMLSPIKARKRREEGQTDISGLNDPKSRGMRSLWEIEERLGLSGNRTRSRTFGVVLSRGGLMMMSPNDAVISVGDRVLGVYDVLDGPMIGGMARYLR